MRKIISGLLAVMFIICLSACDALPPGLRPGSNSSYGNTPSSSSPDTDDGGYVDGRLGDTLYTEWFSFCVDSVEAADEYEGYTARSNHFLIIADITVKNTYGYDLPMSYYDFQVQWGEDEEAYGYGIEESEMAAEYTLRRGETISQQVVYEVPYDNYGEFSISFWEYYENGEYGTVYFIYFEDDILDFNGLDDNVTQRISLL